VSLARLEREQAEERAALYRRTSPAFAAWAAGYGVIRHEALTQVRVWELAELLVRRGAARDRDEVFDRLAAADRLASAVMWLTVHMTYARNVYLDGRPLEAEDFKPAPEGHTGGALNVAIAYVGYLAANALSGVTRAWLVGQGHTVAAIDAANVLVGNTTTAHAERYAVDDAGLTRLVRDFYSYAVRPDGTPESPLGSHVNVHTAGGIMEGGYLGFAELQYVHMPLPGERLVAFLSDGAFEEQRGGDWAPRWWRADDSGLVVPIMIANGRRIDQRTTIAQSGGVEWLRDHLRLNGFDPVDLDGRDPAAYAWAILHLEERLAARAQAVRDGARTYPVPLGYGIAEVPKGFGFPGAGTNAAHNLPLGTVPAVDAEARRRFNEGARALWVPPAVLRQAVAALATHERQGRPLERDHALARRRPPSPNLPEPPWREPGPPASPMEGLDAYFVAIVEANPGLRPRVGNPDELRSNRLNLTLDRLRHRVTAPEPGVAESIDGAVITVLNEEAVVSAALGNKGGINLVVTYEAFAVKMLGAIRQELIFARHQKDAGQSPGWIGVPVVATSHTWENAKNEQSHQDPTLAEALLGEMSDTSRVVFPADWNTTLAALRAVYASRGTIWTLVVPKLAVPARFTAADAERLVADGAARVRGDERAPLLLGAVGAYQLGEALRAADRLAERGLEPAVVSLLEPGRFREPRDAGEAAVAAPAAVRNALFPAAAGVRVFLVHTRPEPFLGAVRPLDTGPGRTRALGFINRGGTLDVPGLLFANRCTWAHAVAAAAEGMGRSVSDFLSREEWAAVRGVGDPAAVLGGRR
jgi:phosphoketolase